MSNAVHQELTESAIPSWMKEGMHEILHRLDTTAKPYPFEFPESLADCICLNQNDYLRLSTHPEVRAARIRMLAGTDSQSLASTLWTGKGLEENGDFRQELAQVMRAEDVLLQSSGWVANVGLVEALATRGTPIYLDQKVHASLWDGARLSEGRPIMVRHNDPESLERRIRRDGAGIVCIDSYYSSNGAVSDVTAYVDICERTGSVLILDEAHSLLMTGEGGGLAVQEGVAERVHFRTSSFSKAMGGHGGCIAGTAHSIWYLKHRSRSSVFSTAPLAIDAAGHRAALAVCQKEFWRAQKCMVMSALFRQELRARGIDPGLSASQLVSIEFEREQQACQAFAMLRENGILASVFIAPAAPKGTGFLRFSIHCEVTPEMVVETATALRNVLDLIPPMEYLP